MRWYLIDKVSEVVPGERVRGQKCVTLSDDVFADHFPDHPIFPGVLVIEAMAQLAGFLLEVTVNTADSPTRRAVLAQIEHAKFHAPAVPGDRLEIEVQLDSLLAGAGRVRAEVHVDSGTAEVGRRRIARAELTFVFVENASDRLHEARKNLYRLWTASLVNPPELR